MEPRESRSRGRRHRVRSRTSRKLMLVLLLLGGVGLLIGAVLVIVAWLRGLPLLRLAGLTYILASIAALAARKAMQVSADVRQRRRADAAEAASRLRDGDPEAAGERHA